MFIQVVPQRKNRARSSFLHYYLFQRKITSNKAILFLLTSVGGIFVAATVSLFSFVFPVLGYFFLKVSSFNVHDFYLDQIMNNRVYHVLLAEEWQFYCFSRKKIKLRGFPTFSGEVSTVKYFFTIRSIVEYLQSNDINCIADFQTILVRDGNGQMQLVEVTGRHRRTMFSVQDISSMKIWTERLCHVCECESMQSLVYLIAYQQQIIKGSNLPSQK